MNHFRAIKWISRVYSLFLCIAVFVLYINDILLPFHTMTLRQELGCRLTFCFIIIAHITLAFLAKDSVVHILTAILLVSLPSLSSFWLLGSVPNWFSFAFSAAILLAYSVKLFIHCKKSNRIWTIVIIIISIVIFLILSSITHSGTKLKTKVLEEYVSPNGQITAQTVEYFSDDFPDTVKVMICSNQTSYLGIFALQLHPCTIYSSTSTSPVEIRWVTDQELTVNGQRYIQEFETNFRMDQP